MSRDGSTIATFLDGEEYFFRLAWGQLIKLQEARGCGPFVIFDRLHGESWLLEDIRDVIKFGLVGGGMDEIKARRLVREYVETQPPLRPDTHGEQVVTPLSIARQVIAAGILGPPDPEPLEKKTTPEINASTISTTDGSGSPSSMAAAP